MLITTTFIGNLNDVAEGNGVFPYVCFVFSHKYKIFHTLHFVQYSGMKNRKNDAIFTAFTK